MLKMNSPEFKQAIGDLDELIEMNPHHSPAGIRAFYNTHAEMALKVSQNVEQNALLHSENSYVLIRWNCGNCDYEHILLKHCSYCMEEVYDQQDVDRLTGEGDKAYPFIFTALTDVGGGEYYEGLVSICNGCFQSQQAKLAGAVA